MQLTLNVSIKIMFRCLSFEIQLNRPRTTIYWLFIYDSFQFWMNISRDCYQIQRTCPYNDHFIFFGSFLLLQEKLVFKGLFCDWEPFGPRLGRYNLMSSFEMIIFIDESKLLRRQGLPFCSLIKRSLLTLHRRISNASSFNINSFEKSANLV